MNGIWKEIRSENRGITRRETRNGRQRAYTVSVVPYSDNQVLVDEDEDDIYAAMNTNGNKRRDSQTIKQTIVQSFNELQQKNQQLQQHQIENVVYQLKDIQKNQKLNDIRKNDTYDLL